MADKPDIVVGNFYCPFCGHPTPRLQTNDLGLAGKEYNLKRIMKHIWSLGAEIQIYGNCDECKRPIQIIIDENTEQKFKKAKKREARYEQLSPLKEKMEDVISLLKEILTEENLYDEYEWDD